MKIKRVVTMSDFQEKMFKLMSRDLINRNLPIGLSRNGKLVAVIDRPPEDMEFSRVKVQKEQLEAVGEVKVCYKCKGSDFLRQVWNYDTVEYICRGCSEVKK